MSRDRVPRIYGSGFQWFTVGYWVASDWGFKDLRFQGFRVQTFRGFGFQGLNVSKGGP